ncbi:MAG: hypothetical protein V4456_13810 [Bacteroidota bacterium]
MKTIRYIAAIALVAVTITACGDRSKATLGGTKDTVAKAGTGDPNNTQAADTAKKDSLNKGNADPSGRNAVDTADARPVH